MFRRRFCNFFLIRYRLSSFNLKCSLNRYKANTEWAISMHTLIHVHSIRLKIGVNGLPAHIHILKFSECASDFPPTLLLEHPQNPYFEKSLVQICGNVSGLIKSFTALVLTESSWNGNLPLNGSFWKWNFNWQGTLDILLKTGFEQDRVLLPCWWLLSSEIQNSVIALTESK